MKRSARCLAILMIIFLPAVLAHADEPVPINDYIVDVGSWRADGLATR